MKAEPKNTEELVAVLQELAQVIPADRAELEQLENRCIALSVYLGNNPRLGMEIDESIWHFLSDADIRFKDAGYAEAQLAGLKERLASLTRGA